MQLRLLCHVNTAAKRSFMRIDRELHSFQNYTGFMLKHKSLSRSMVNGWVEPKMLAETEGLQRLTKKSVIYFRWTKTKSCRGSNKFTNSGGETEGRHEGSSRRTETWTVQDEQLEWYWLGTGNIQTEGGRKVEAPGMTVG